MPMRVKRKDKFRKSRRSYLVGKGVAGMMCIAALTQVNLESTTALWCDTDLVELEISTDTKLPKKNEHVLVNSVVEQVYGVVDQVYGGDNPNKRTR
jgi:hypothetical protein